MNAAKRFTVGQEVVIDPRNGRQQDAVVTKVARKYVTVEIATSSAWDRTREFDMTTSMLKGFKYTGDRIYTTDEWAEVRLLRAERKRAERHRDFLRNIHSLSRADLARLNDLLDELNAPEGLPS